MLGHCKEHLKVGEKVRGKERALVLSRRRRPEALLLLLLRLLGDEAVGVGGEVGCESTTMNGMLSRLPWQFLALGV